MLKEISMPTPKKYVAIFFYWLVFHQYPDTDTDTLNSHRFNSTLKLSKQSNQAPRTGYGPEILVF